MIFRLDGRQEVESQWWDKARLGTRATLQVGGTLALLHLAPLSLADQGLYTCRADFRSQPTKTTRVNLTLIGALNFDWRFILIGRDERSCLELKS